LEKLTESVQVPQGEGESVAGSARLIVIFAKLGLAEMAYGTLDQTAHRLVVLN
jgi:hypothetical protein